MNVKWFVKYATKFSQHQGWQWPNESIVSGVAPVGLTMCVTTSGLLLHHETSS